MRGTTGTTSARNRLRRLAYGGALLSALTAQRFGVAPEHDRARRCGEPMAALCGLDQSGFLRRCRDAGGGTPARPRGFP
ncbi:hypothetical protein [Streptomyces sp. NPDC001070]